MVDMVDLVDLPRGCGWASWADVGLPLEEADLTMRSTVHHHDRKCLSHCHLTVVNLMKHQVHHTIPGRAGDSRRDQGLRLQPGGGVAEPEAGVSLQGGQLPAFPDVGGAGPGFLLPQREGAPAPPHPPAVPGGLHPPHFAEATVLGESRPLASRPSAPGSWRTWPAACSTWRSATRFSTVHGGLTGW
jgi:hypothetical protein